MKRVNRCPSFIGAVALAALLAVRCASPDVPVEPTAATPVELTFVAYLDAALFETDVFRGEGDVMQVAIRKATARDYDDLCVLLDEREMKESPTCWG